MRGPVMAIFAAIVASGGCVQTQPQGAVETPTSEPPLAAPEEPASAATTASPEEALAVESPPANLEEPAPAATTVSPATAPAGEAPRPAATQPATTVTPTRPAVAAAESQPDTAPPAAPTQGPGTAGTSPPAARSAATEAAPPRAQSTPPVPPPAAAAARAAPIASPELDLAGLEQRLRETRAIGMFTKLSLKNQVDDLLGQFRAVYQGQLDVPMAELRERYELLLFKVLTLIQDADRELADAIAASREAIWGILSDPQKLARIG